MLELSLEAPVRNHLKQVYTCLSMSTLVAAVGAYVHVFTDILHGNFLTAILSIICMLALQSIPHEPKNQNLRLSLLMGFSFLAGLGMGPLIGLAVMVNPSLVATAFLATCLIFVCFSLSAMFSKNGAYLYLGGILGSILSTMLFMQLLNFFIRSSAISQTNLYLGLFVFCGFVLYDTQKTIEKRRHGDTDYIGHSLALFLDLVNVFQHILVILLQSQDTKRKKKNSRD